MERKCGAVRYEMLQLGWSLKRLYNCKSSKTNQVFTVTSCLYEANCFKVDSHRTDMMQPAIKQPENSRAWKKQKVCCIKLVVWICLKLVKMSLEITDRTITWVSCIILFCPSWSLNQKGDPAGVFWHLHSPPSRSGADPQEDVYCSNSHRSSQWVWKLHPTEQVDWGETSLQMVICAIMKANTVEHWHCGLCVCVWRSVGEIPACADFDCSLQEDNERLNPRELELNDLTFETIQHKWEQITQSHPDD